MAKMNSKKNRTIEVYMDAGAKARLLKTIWNKFYIAISKNTPANELHKLDTARKTIEHIISDAEDRMFREYPDLPREYINVFYGDVDMNNITSKVDEEVTKYACDYICDILGLLTKADKEG